MFFMIISDASGRGIGGLVLHMPLKEAKAEGKRLAGNDRSVKLYRMGKNEQPKGEPIWQRSAPAP